MTEQPGAETPDQVAQLGRALAATEAVITAAGDERWSSPTPCPDWDLRDLVTHLAAGNYVFADALNGTPPGAGAESARPAGDPLSYYRGSAAALLAAFRQPGVLDRVVTVPFGAVPGIVALHLRLTEVLVHGWDVTRATGQPGSFPEEIAEAELRFSRAQLTRIPPGRSPFAPSRPAADDAPAIDRLAACLGRDVTPPTPA